MEVVRCEKCGEGYYTSSPRYNMIESCPVCSTKIKERKFPLRLSHFGAIMSLLFIGLLCISIGFYFGYQDGVKVGEGKCLWPFVITE